MSGNGYTEEFRIEAVKQVTERGYKPSEVAKRLGVTTNSLYNWIKRYGDQLLRWDMALALLHTCGSMRIIFNLLPALYLLT